MEVWGRLVGTAKVGDNVGSRGEAEVEKLHRSRKTGLHEGENTRKGEQSTS